MYFGLKSVWERTDPWWMGGGPGRCFLSLGEIACSSIRADIMEMQHRGNRLWGPRPHWEWRRV